MDFGMPTLIENKDIYENVSLCKRRGLDFVELNMNLPDYRIEKLEQTELYGELAKQHGIYFTIHLDENLNIADFNNAVSDAYVDTVKRAIAVSKKLGVPILNMHMNHGVHFTLPDKKVQLFEEYYEAYEYRFSRFINMCEEEIGSSDIKVCVENTDGFTAYEKKVISLMLESEVFALTFDIGHSSAAQNADEEFLLKNENHLAHFHIHDGNGTIWRWARGRLT